MKPFFSIIVPCCNVSAYIPELLRSLAQQRFRDFEVILVVETSEDDTLELCQATAAHDPAIHVYQQEKSGSPASPRNTGLAHASGRYIVFLDGDDLLASDTLETLADMAKRHREPDLISFAAREFETTATGKIQVGNRYFNYFPGDDEAIFSGVEATCRIGERALYPYPMVWMSVCRKAFLDQWNLWQSPGLIHEDEEWSPRVLFLAKRVLVLDRELYRYRKRRNSIMTAEKVLDLKSFARILRSLFAFAASHEVPDAVYRVWQRTWLSFFFRYFFYPETYSKVTDQARLEALHLLLEDEGTQWFRDFIKHATWPKWFAGHLILLCRKSESIFCLRPVLLYFQYFYYPLIIRRKSDETRNHV